jgi:hypothetical protein
VDVERKSRYDTYDVWMNARENRIMPVDKFFILYFLPFRIYNTIEYILYANIMVISTLPLPLHQQLPYLNFHLHVLAPQFFCSPNSTFTLTSRNRFPLISLPLTPVKLSNDGKVFVQLSSTPPPRSRLSLSLFEGPAQCTRSRYMIPRL